MYLLYAGACTFKVHRACTQYRYPYRYRYRRKKASEDSSNEFFGRAPGRGAAFRQVASSQISWGAK